MSSRTQMQRHVLATQLLLLGGALTFGFSAAAADWPVTAGQRDTAQRVAEAGVPLSELSADAPDRYTVKTGDTLWAISQLFLRSPWRWPELWGMNRGQISNPHLIYPGQELVLVRVNGRAQLQLSDNSSADALPTVKLNPRLRSSDLKDTGIPAIPLHLIEPFLSEAVVFDNDQLLQAPRIIGAQDDRVWMSKGDIAYARGDLSQASEYRVFRKPVPLKDPLTHEILGYEAVYVGTADLRRQAEDGAGAKALPGAGSLMVRQAKLEIEVGDRLSPVAQRGFTRYVPHAPSQPISGSIISIYGDAMSAGQNQIVALNRGAQDGVETGHVLALWNKGREVLDETGPRRQNVQLPDERHGLLFVFQVYQRVSYALILSVQEPVTGGDRFTQP